MSELYSDISANWELFAQLTQQEMTRAVRKAISTGLEATKQKTISNLKASIKEPGSSDGRYTDTLESGVITGFLSTDFDDETTGRIHIMGRRQKGGGTHRLRMLEAGTRERYQKTVNGVQLKKARRLGHITPKRFFKTAVETMQSSIESIMLQALDTAVAKINAKKR